MEKEPLSLEVASGAFVVLETSRPLAAFVTRLCAGVAAAPAGRVDVLGHDPRDMARADLNRLRYRLGVALQPGGLISNQTLRANLRIALLFGDSTLRADAARMCDEMIDAAGLERWADRRPAEVPEEPRQIAAVARALVRRPELILLEDPMASLESDEVAARVLALVRARAATVLVATHRARGPLTLAADRIVSW